MEQCFIRFDSPAARSAANQLVDAGAAEALLECHRALGGAACGSWVVASLLAGNCSMHRLWHFLTAGWPEEALALLPKFTHNLNVRLLVQLVASCIGSDVPCRKKLLGRGIVKARTDSSRRDCSCLWLSWCPSATVTDSHPFFPRHRQSCPLCLRIPLATTSWGATQTSAARC